MRMKDKVAIVTGAASGIGLEIALAYAREGAKIAIADLKQDAAEAAATEIKNGGGQAIAVAMDVTNEAQVDAGVETTVKALGGVDVLVSNAGIQIVGPIQSISLCRLATLLAVHLDGAFLTTHACLRHMYRAGRAASSIWARSIQGGLAAEGALCHRQARADRAVQDGGQGGRRLQCARQCRLSRFVRTPLVERQFPEQAKELGISEADVIKKVMLRETVDGEFTTTADVAECAVLFGSFASNALTGQSIVVSHGWFMQ